MKLRYLYGIMIIFLLLSCKKEEPQIDYRQGWVGKYECQLVMSTSIDTATKIKKVIVRTQSVKDSSIVFKENGLDQNHSGLYYDTLKVSINGALKKINSFSTIITGKFVKDSLYVHYIDPSPGISMVREYKGKHK